MALTFSQSLQIGQVAGPAELGPRLVLQPLGRWVGVRVVETHAARQQEAPHHVVDLAPENKERNVVYSVVYDMIASGKSTYKFVSHNNSIAVH